VYAVILTSNIAYLVTERRNLRVYVYQQYTDRVHELVVSSSAPTQNSSQKALPPLEALIDPNDDSVNGIKSDVSFMLDIAILGHAKCATTFLLDWLRDHPEIQMFQREVCDLYDRKPAKLVHRLYTELLPNNETHSFQRGFKCPGHFSRTPLRLLSTQFPNAKLIVGLRHPVKYFESYYNFRARHPQHNWTTLPPAETLIGTNNCSNNPASQGVCTEHAKFHTNLAKLGKTNWRDEREQKLLHLTRQQQHLTVVRNPLFLYDMEQLYDTNVTRQAQFGLDMERFLGLHSPLNPLIPPTPEKKTKVLDICQPQYRELRDHLVNIGGRASRWILDFLLKSSSNVVVSSPEQFEAILNTWKHDPCKSKTTTVD